jgi:pSer/pThr/pTyr-binding forkhead associated (FHA) protein
VCDLGSLNGTYVNDELIGRRDLSGRSEEDTLRTSPDHLLHAGDKLQVGDVLFDVQIRQ